MGSERGTSGGPCSASPERTNQTLSVLAGKISGVAEERIGAAAARRIAIAAQGLDKPAPVGGPVPNRGHLRRLMDRIGVLQIDSVNVLARAHYLPVFSRLGAYPSDLLAQAAWPRRPADRLLVETWGHEACLVPAEVHPLLRWERRHWSNKHSIRMQHEHPGLLEEITQLIGDRGPMTAGEVEKAVQTEQPGRPGWWEWSLTKQACEALFSAGVLGVAGRRGFERQYDLLDRVLPPAIVVAPVPEPAAAKRRLAELAARAHGIGSASDLADYFRMPVADTKAALAELVEEGVVRRVAVQGWREPAYLHAQARLPRRVQGRALLCPFDPLIWERSRTERLFGFEYRIEIYTPAPRRRYGYYVFPLLLGDRLVGRFDLKADRAGGALLVQAAWSEPGTDPVTVASAAVPELRRMAGWLGLERIVVAPRGDLHGELSRRLGGSLPP